MTAKEMKTKHNFLVLKIMKIKLTPQNKYITQYPALFHFIRPNLSMALRFVLATGFLAPLVACRTSDIAGGISYPNYIEGQIGENGMVSVQLENEETAELQIIFYGSESVINELMRRSDEVAELIQQSVYMMNCEQFDTTIIEERLQEDVSAMLTSGIIESTSVSLLSCD